jgi:hypothetical protein
MSLQEQERERVAEQWLDEAIGYLGDAGPRSGLETRILAGLRAYGAQRRRRWALVVAASAAAVLLAGLVASWPRSKPEAGPSVVQKTSPAGVASEPVVANVDTSHKKDHPRIRGSREIEAASVRHSPLLRPAVETREATFPSAAPLNEQGRLLQAYLRQTPPQQLALIAPRQPSPSSLESEDIKIAPLQIADLTPKAEATKDQNQN